MLCRSHLLADDVPTTERHRCEQTKFVAGHAAACTSWCYSLRQGRIRDDTAKALWMGYAVEKEPVAGSAEQGATRADLRTRSRACHRLLLLILA